MNSFAIRMELFRDAWEQFKLHPWFGKGAGAFGQQSCWKDVVAHPHNVILQALAELGLLGAIVLASILTMALVYPLFSPWQPSDHSNLGFMIYLFACFNSLVNGNYFTSVDLWWSCGLMATWCSRNLMDNN